MDDPGEDERMLLAALAAAIRCRSALAEGGPVEPGPLREALARLGAAPLPAALRPLLLALLDELVPLREALGAELAAAAERLAALDAHSRAGRAYLRSPGT